ncbi:MAG: tetratricopeptide repeat protein [Methanomassiliicoccales archaeon]|nr:MAG: tetratricopeptide repeat protein [Methanomassiliicoccales archaeon]
MDVPPDIRRRSRKESLSDLMHAMKVIRATKAASSAIDFIDRNDYASALAELIDAEEVFKELDDMVQVANMLSLQALCLYALGRMAEAEVAMRRAVALRSDLGASESRATDLLGLGEILLKKGEPREAMEAFLDAKTVFEGLGLDDGVERSMAAMKRAKAAMEGMA